MAQRNLKARISWRRDTDANWIVANPILLNGEIIIVDTDDGDIKFKVGDGSKTYTELPFIVDLATNIKEGLMSSADKEKLDNISQGAQANIQSDWDENDETSDAYVQNRTHWRTCEDIVIIDNETYEFNPSYSTYEADPSPHFYETVFDELSAPLEVGNKYILTLDGIDYECVAYPSYEYVCIGNASILESDGEDTGEPFFMYTYFEEINTYDLDPDAPTEFICWGVLCTALEGDSHTISLSGNVIRYYKLDRGYLPSLVGQFGSAPNSEVFNGYNGINKASEEYAHAEGYSTTASGYASHAEGYETIAAQFDAHAEGYLTVADGEDSHAEGSNSKALGSTAHAEGSYTTASGYASHAEGFYTTASGYASHAEGTETCAAGKSQHVEGEYNIIDNVGHEEEYGKYIHIVGNGWSEDSRSNAHTLDWEGNAWFAGDVKVGGTGQDDVNAKTLATTSTIFNGIFMRDAVNGFTYIVQMMNGNLVSYLKTVGIEITTQPNIMNYLEGTPLDTTGMVVSAICEDGSKREITNYTTEGNATINNPVFIIKYTEGGETHSVELHVTVEEFDENILQDFDYIKNDDGTYTLTGWKQTLNGVPSTELVVPDYPNIIV